MQRGLADGTERRIRALAHLPRRQGRGDLAGQIERHEQPGARAFQTLLRQPLQR
jgi:hypothetical protein